MTTKVKEVSILIIQASEWGLGSIMPIILVNGATMKIVFDEEYWDEQCFLNLLVTPIS